MSSALSTPTSASSRVLSMTLEQALRCIDQFAEPGRSRILLVLPYHFYMPGGRV
ncbi:Uncharacterised protein [Janthinobacterium lividum]|nr:hypothetical protein JANLI_30190 [Janthinobacterium lividum]STQ95616.1 Uncharacterised protein [Janthinobacterium lividum]